MGNAFIYFDFYNVFQANADSFTLYCTLLSTAPTLSSKFNSGVFNVS